MKKVLTIIIVICFVLYIAVHTLNNSPKLLKRFLQITSSSKSRLPDNQQYTVKTGNCFNGHKSLIYAGMPNAKTFSILSGRYQHNIYYPATMKKVVLYYYDHQRKIIVKIVKVTPEKIIYIVIREE